ncbi:hypothetical protein MKK75_01015 [Methylobacterium sp. J-030]|uniref:hypothetical protein n=1 Tax=Methylobacterium sp. J-030 TaxID=2836627 RepID=UPI001FBB1B12|nr:hypothetical protein [Methylobacterium sp. J-030]MCJ2067396.1 hypothetical protein [Methylobacterium sp. J-030]
MPATDFDSFVQQQQDNKENIKEFWGRERDQYIDYVNKVYGTIEEFLAPWTSTGSVTIEYHEQEIHEEDTGVYNVRKCIISIGNRFIALTPIGTQLIGTKGRIDISGAFGRSRLILVDKDATGIRVSVTHVDLNDPQSSKAEKPPEKEIDWTWKIVSNPPNMKFIEFNKENFLSKIMEISNG